MCVLIPIKITCCESYVSCRHSLHKATIEGDLNQVKLMKFEGVDMNVEDDCGR